MERAAFVSRNEPVNRWHDCILIIDASLPWKTVPRLPFDERLTTYTGLSLPLFLLQNHC